MEQQSTTSNIAGGEAAQPETNVPQQQPQQQIRSPENDLQISFFNPELLRVGFIGLFHNLSVLVSVLFDFVGWSMELDNVIKWKREYPNAEYNYYNRDSMKIIHQNVTVFKVLCCVFLYLIASAMSVGAIVMDVFLRESTYPANHHQQKAKLQRYLIFNVVFLGFGLVMSALIYFYLRIIYPHLQLYLLVSHCLRAVCIFVVFQSWTLLRQQAGLTNFGGYPIPFSGHKNQSLVQSIPSTQVQQDFEEKEMEQQHQSTTSNRAAGEATQPETKILHQSKQQTTSFEKDVLLSFLKPELFCVGFISLFHNLSLLVILLCYFIYWSYGLDEMIKKDRDGKVNHTHTVNDLTNATVGKVLGFLIAHLIGFLLAIGATVMDVFLRGTTNPANNRSQNTKLKCYIIWNVVCLTFGLLMSILLYFCIPIMTIGSSNFLGLTVSHCLRAVCIFIVYKYWTLLRQTPGFKKFGSFPAPFTGQNQDLEQTVPSTQM